MATKGDITGLPVLMFGGKPMVPQVAIGGFTRYRKSGVVNSDASGGATRQRKKYFGGTHVAEVTFYLETAQQQDYLELFFSRNEGSRFICHLAADRPIVEPYVVQVIGDVSYSEVTAKDSVASMTMEIFSARDADLDQFLADTYPLVGDLYEVLTGFHPIVEAMPIE